MLIFAEQGDIVADETDETITFRLQDGTIHRQQSGDDSTYQLINFRSYEVQPDLTDNGDNEAENAGRKKRPKEMSTGQLWQQLSSNEGDQGGRKIGAIKAEVHTRLASPMAPLIFAAGANCLMTGDYLTTKGRLPEEDRQMLADLGLELISEQ